MDNLTDILKTCIIFKNFNKEDIEILFKKINYNIYSYIKEETIAMEGENCSNIGIVLEGSIEIKKFFASGKTVTIAKFLSGDIFGEVIIFSDINKYPSTIVASDNCKILFISKEDIVTLCGLNNLVLNNFMGLLSNKILILNKKLKNLSYETLRQKISSFLLESYHMNEKIIFQISSSRSQMAEELGVPRPSLSRELVNMKKDGLIDFHKNTFKILDLGSMEDILIN
ncbi:Crp/Fnr family transcriptional regulator [Clostridium arbusti]|uniref:Crp/Fnr family transcriptional regulator n=1 Tax=Clostridium arbusti TaxID=1137848 RepID=UPI00028A1316|nr:Crp/Fnr family transcriptional regulator [Clostridium arbusti]